MPPTNQKSIRERLGITIAPLRERLSQSTAGQFIPALAENATKMSNTLFKTAYESLKVDKPQLSEGSGGRPDQVSSGQRTDTRGRVISNTLEDNQNPS